LVVAAEAVLRRQDAGNVHAGSQRVVDDVHERVLKHPGGVGEDGHAAASKRLHEQPQANLDEGSGVYSQETHSAKGVPQNSKKEKR
jgi:hypothetical protein